MDQLHYQEMASNVHMLIQEGVLRDKKIYLFGHCNATEELADLLLNKGFFVEAILDNNPEKYKNEYCGIKIRPPQDILASQMGKTLVCIAARAYAAMADQLKRIGYTGEVRKVVDYNSFAEYSLSENTIERMYARKERGIILLERMKKKYPGSFRFLCPFFALGDIYFTMSYLSCFMRKRNIKKCVIGVIGHTSADVVRMFGEYDVEIFAQKDMDEMVQAALYTQDAETFIPHQDRPYAVNLHKALYVKCIPLERIYCCGVYGLPAETKPCKPSYFERFGGLGQIRQGKAVIISPYAKSVTALPDILWEQIISAYAEQGFQCFTNIAGDEQPLPGTVPIRPAVSELQSVVEYAGAFVGIRSGLCDILRTAKADKTALFPDYNYCDTKWKAIDMYKLEGWQNIVVKDGFRWKKN